MVNGSHVVRYYARVEGTAQMARGRKLLVKAGRFEMLRTAEEDRGMERAKRLNIARKTLLNRVRKPNERLNGYARVALLAYTLCLSFRISLSLVSDSGDPPAGTFGR